MSQIKTENQIAVVRPPIISVLGHIDHGKSSLLDYIRKTKVVEKEAGGITQGISAYKFEHKTGDGLSRTLTFIDTPGHEAFEKMRRRGARVADIAILVVSAEDGVKPQTIEAYKAIEEAKVPFVVAITKIDKPNADLNKTKNSLAEAGIYLEGYGGSISFVGVSSKTGEGVKELLDLLVLTADVSEFKGKTDNKANGYIIESTRDSKKGIRATLIVKDGTLLTGTFVVCGNAWAPVRILEDFLGKPVKDACCGHAVALSGWSSVPPVGEEFKVVASKKEAEVESLMNKKSDPKKENLKDVGEKKPIVVGIKADTFGSIEAILHEIKKISHERVVLQIVHSGIGNIGESDIKSVMGSQTSIILGFNVMTDAQATALAERQGIKIQTFDIIYKLLEWLAEFVKENAPKIEVEEIVGEAKIMRFFSRVKDRQIVGGKVLKGQISIGHKVKILRREVEIGTGIIKELQQQKAKTSKVEEGFEFGSMIEAKLEIAPGDIISDCITVEKQ